METTAQERFRQVLSQAAADPVYQRLQRECDALDPAFLAVLEKLPEKDRAVITAYIQTLGASALRMTELSCEKA